MERPTKDDYYLNIAKEVCKRGTCLRRRFGSVIVKNDEIVSTGYVGAPRGAKNCIDTGKCLRQTLNIPAGERYELCRSVHAEANSIISAARERMMDAILYLYGENVEDNSIAIAQPCKMCKRLIINAGIKTVKVRTLENRVAEYLIQDWVENEPIEFDQENIKGY